MPKASPPRYTVTSDGGYMLFRQSGEPIRYRKFQHRQLSSERSIRLIKRIRTYEGDNSFNHFHIEERSLDDPTLKYDAVSYVWGKHSETAPLIFGNEADGSVRLITKTAWQAIETLCMYERLLWIDQICVNQDDKQEMKFQIPLMGEIYSSQKRFVTVVWLGAADNETEAAFDLVERLSKVMPLKKDVPIGMNEAFHMPHDMIRKKIQATDPDYKPPADEDPSWESLAKIFARTWYSRMWTFQEVVLTDLDDVSIVCASENISCKTTLRRLIRASILLGAYSVPGHDDDIVENRQSLYLIDTMQARLKKRLPCPLHYLLQVTASRDCHDPKDKIYALLNVQRNVLEMSAIEVQPTISPSEVYADVTRKILASEMSLLICLSASGRDGGKVEELPSWVPDYSGLILAPYLEALDPKAPLFSASRNRKWRALLNQPGSTLSWQQLMVQGRSVDTIADVDDNVMPAKAGGDEIHAYLRRVLPIVMSKSGRATSRDEIDRKILRLATTVICGGYNTYLFNFRAFSFMLGPNPASGVSSTILTTAKGHAVEDLEMLRRMFFGPGYVHNAASLNENERTWYHDFGKQAALCKGRRFGFLSNFGVGLVPQQTKKGDIVAILHGSSLPVILRGKQPYGPFQLIGPCFVDGLMFGESVTWAEDDSHSFLLV